MKNIIFAFLLFWSFVVSGQTYCIDSIRNDNCRLEFINSSGTIVRELITKDITWYNNSVGSYIIRDLTTQLTIRLNCLDVPEFDLLGDSLDMWIAECQSQGSLDSFYSCNQNEWLFNGDSISCPSGGGSSLGTNIYFPSHGISVNSWGATPIFIDSLGVPKVAYTTDSTLMDLYAIDSVHQDTLKVVDKGIINATHGLDFGKYYYLQKDSTISINPDSTINQVIAKPVATNYLQLFNERPVWVISTPTSPVDTCTWEDNNSFAFNGSRVNFNSDSTTLFSDGSTKIARTFSIWIRFNGAVLTRPIMSKDNLGSQRDYALAFYSGTKLRFLMKDLEGDQIARETATLTIDTDWHHVAVTYDTDSIRIYIDSVRVDITNVNTGTFGIPNNSTETISMSSRNGSNNMASNISQHSWFNGALSASEIAELYNHGSPIDPKTHSQSANLTHAYYYGDCDDEALLVKDRKGIVDGVGTNTTISTDNPND